jgi:hypothetical protein
MIEDQKQQSLIQQQQTIQQNKVAEYSRLCQNKPFWIFDSVKHEAEYRATGGNCCFTHIIPAQEPMKYGKRHKFYDYQQQILEILEQYKRLYLLKAGGIGATELLLRYMAYLCLSQPDKFKDSQMVIITGPRIDLSISLVRRLKALFYPDVVFADKETVCQLLTTRMEALPSNSLQAARGLPNVSFILADEAAFFTNQFEVRSIIDRYVLKSDSIVALISTPSHEGDLMDEIRKESDESCQYKRLFMDYTVTLDKLYSIDEINNARRTSPAFEREFNLSFTHSIGNVFSTASIERAIDLGRLPGADQLHIGGRRAMGIDVGFSTSKTSIVILQTTNNRLQVLHSSEHERPSYEALVHYILKLYREYRVSNIYVDASAVSLIASVKSLLREPSQNYEEDMHNLEKQHPFTPVQRLRVVIPLAWNRYNKEMLQNLKMFLDDDRVGLDEHVGMMQISAEKHQSVLTALRGATAEELSLLKEESPGNDTLEALMAACHHFRYVPIGGGRK